MLSGWQDQLAHTGLFINCETYLFLAVDWLRLGGLQLQCVHWGESDSAIKAE